PLGGPAAFRILARSQEADPPLDQRRRWHRIGRRGLNRGSREASLGPASYERQQSQRLRSAAEEPAAGSGDGHHAFGILSYSLPGGNRAYGRNPRPPRIAGTRAVRTKEFIIATGRSTLTRCAGIGRFPRSWTPARGRCSNRRPAISEASATVVR